MLHTLGREVFRIADTTYRWEDVVLAARLWGDWAALERQVREGIACVKRLEETEGTLDPEEMESAANGFRDERDLISAEEMESWLEERGLTAAMWMEYIRRSLLRQRWSAELADLVSRYPVPDEEVEPLIECEGICCGQLGQFSQKLAARAAVYDRLIEQAGAEAMESTPAKDLTRLEVAFRDFCDRVPTPEAIARQLNVHSLDWIRIDCRFLAFTDEETAREAAFCVREDGKPLAEVAAQARTVEQQASFLLEEIEPELREHFLAASKGELLGPLRRGGEFALFLVVEKVMPVVEDSRIRERAERQVVEDTVKREIDARIRWHDRW